MSSSAGRSCPRRPAAQMARAAGCAVTDHQSMAIAELTGLRSGDPRNVVTRAGPGEASGRDVTLKSCHESLRHVGDILRMVGAIDAPPRVDEIGLAGRDIIGQFSTGERAGLKPMHEDN